MTSIGDTIVGSWCRLGKPRAPILNVEENEMSMPMMYLFKREQEDYLGHGEYRTARNLYCTKPHKTKQVQNAMSTKS